MRLVLISDTHEKHERVNVPEGDVLVHAGDFTNDGSLEYVKSFNKWIGLQPHKYKIVIAGNHEVYFGKHLTLDDRRDALSNCTYLENEGIDIEGHKFWGSPVTPRFGQGWAFMVTRNSKELEEHWSTIPYNTDVLITHGPAFGILDQSGEYSEHVGDEKLAKIVNAVCPAIHVFGHIHGGYGLHLANYSTLHINAATCNESYSPTNEPVVIEI